MSMRPPGFILSFVLAAAAVVPALPAAADHTNPNEPVVPPDPAFFGEATTTGEGKWEFIKNFPAPVGNALLGSGTDHKVFRIGDNIYAAAGTLGQGNEFHIGQRIVRLTDGEKVDPVWVADHGSAACTPANASVTGLQHDPAVAGMPDRRALRGIDALAAQSLAVIPEVLIDTTDATGRCHDGPGGGLELIDISDLGQPKFEPREIHLIRFPGFSHTVTVDERRPWVVYSSSSDFSGRPWIDVVDVRSCLGLGPLSLQEKRGRCRPSVFRISFEPAWSQRRDASGKLVPGTEASCHDITSRGDRIYCAGLNATLIFDVRNLTRPGSGAVRGIPLTCPRIDGTNTKARVTNCAGIDGTDVAQAEGWRFLGTVNHAGRICTPIPPQVSTACNTNTEARSDEDISVSHEADPSPDGRLLFVTDERGGGVVPPGASCAPGVDNPNGNGGIHVFDISNPSKILYARTPTKKKAIWIGEPVVPAASFCTVHVIEQIPGEQRFTVAYYTQGTKILDYFVDRQGRVSFRETASIVFRGANTWSVDVFKIDDNRDGTRTYYLVASDIGRGIDVFSLTLKPNPIGSTPPRGSAAGMAAAYPLAAAVLVLSGWPIGERIGRRRRPQRRAQPSAAGAVTSG